MYICPVNPARLEIFHAFLSSADFFKNTFSKKNQEYHQCQNRLDPDQAQHSIGPDMDPSICLHLGYQLMTLVMS